MRCASIQNVCRNPWAKGAAIVVGLSGIFAAFALQGLLSGKVTFQAKMLLPIIPGATIFVGSVGMAVCLKPPVSLKVEKRAEKSVMEENLTERLVAFYNGTGSTWEGKEGATLKEVQTYFRCGGDFTHQPLRASELSVIQWLFPTSSSSRHNQHAPQLDSKIKLPKMALQKSFHAFLAYLGLKYEGEQVLRSEQWEERYPKWVKNEDHNCLRLTRVIISLFENGLKNEAIALRWFLIIDLCKNEGKEIPSDTVQLLWANETISCLAVKSLIAPRSYVYL